MAPQTIKSKREFGEVFQSGKRYSARLVRAFVLNDDKGGVADGKVAFVAAKRLGSAPVRNRAKRVLREAARLCDLPLPGAKIILFAKESTAASHPNEVAQDISYLLRKAGLL